MGGEGGAQDKGLPAIVVKIPLAACRVANKSRILRAGKSRKFLLNMRELERRGVKEDGGEGVFERWGFEEEDVAVVEDAADES